MLHLGGRSPESHLQRRSCLLPQLASCLVYAQAFLEYVITIMWLRSVTVREIRGR